MPDKSYRIDVHRRVLKDLDVIDSRSAQRLRDRIDALKEAPYPNGSQRLRNLQTGLPHPAYRVRAGDYRVVYMVDENTAIVYVLAVGHRSAVYRRFQ